MQTQNKETKAEVIQQELTSVYTYDDVSNCMQELIEVNEESGEWPPHVIQDFTNIYMPAILDNLKAMAEAGVQEHGPLEALLLNQRIADETEQLDEVAGIEDEVEGLISECKNGIRKLFQTHDQQNRAIIKGRTLALEQMKPKT